MRYGRSSSTSKRGAKFADSIACIGMLDTSLSVNSAFTSLTGYTEEEVVMEAAANVGKSKGVKGFGKQIFASNAL